SALDVSVVAANGSGCPNSPATATVGPDGSTVTIAFSGYYAWTGSDASVTDWRKNCQFNLSVQAPDGQSYAVEGADYSGFALAREGVTGIQATSYYVQGQSATTTVTHRFTGPTARTWKTQDVIDEGDLSWSPCGVQRNLNVNTELRLTPA